MNKLTIEDQFLNFSQTKELKEFGIDFSGANHSFIHSSEWENNKWELYDSTSDSISTNNEFEYYDIVPTLSVAEMMEMLPNEISCLEDGFLTHYYLIYDGCSMGYVEWCGGEISHYKINISGGVDFTDGDKICIEKWNLRDVLFEMLRWLKQNKLI